MVGPREYRVRRSEAAVKKRAKQQTGPTGQGESRDCTSIGIDCRARHPVCGLPEGIDPGNDYEHRAARASRRRAHRRRRSRSGQLAEPRTHVRRSSASPRSTKSTSTTRSSSGSRGRSTSIRIAARKRRRSSSTASPYFDERLEQGAGDRRGNRQVALAIRSEGARRIRREGVLRHREPRRRGVSRPTPSRERSTVA